MLAATVALTSACSRTGPSLTETAGAEEQPEASPEVAATATTEPTPAPDTTDEPISVPTRTSPPAPSPEPTAAPAPTAPPAPTAASSPTPVPRLVNEQGWEPFAVIGDLTLHHPAAIVERIGLHQSGHDGARQMDLLDVPTQTMTMESRGRRTLARTAADIVVEPGTEIRSPVTGTVLSAGTYVLYCEYSDDFVWIEPDARPGWQVKMFHIDRVQVAPGQRVEAGVTVLAPRATQLPFESQIDEFTAEPSWPHVHIEVVDPTIPDRPSEGGGC